MLAEAGFRFLAFPAASTCGFVFLAAPTARPDPPEGFDDCGNVTTSEPDQQTAPETKVIIYEYCLFVNK